jgi:NADH-quinone oxidoreductase subunit H
MPFWSDPLFFISQWLQQQLVNAGMSETLAYPMVNIAGAVVLPLLSLLWVIFLIWYERKLIGRIQDRFGPNRLGPWGLFQPFADMVKIFAKEYITPTGADKIPYNLAPILVVASVMFMWAVIPFTATTYGANINVGVLYIIAVGAIGELGIILAGYASNNKYSLLAGFRVVAQLISYEVPMVLSLLVPVLLSRSMGINSIIQSQTVWYIVIAPVAALIFFYTSVAEVGRSPFDLAEAESEIVAGFNIEYSGLKFGMFYVGEFLHAFTASMVYTVLFLGGWQGPGAVEIPILGFFYFGIKTMIVYFVFILFRGSLPRFRIDQMMALNWKILTPIALVVLCLTAIIEKQYALATPLVRNLALMGGNILVVAVVVLVSRKPLQDRREKIEQFADENRAMAQKILGE